MTFYSPKSDKWLCLNCETLNNNNVIVCPHCLLERDPGPDVEMPAGCSCFEYVGDNLRCPVHGVNVAEVAA